MRERSAAMDSHDYHHNMNDFKETKLTRNLKFVDELKAISYEHNCSPGEVNIAWALHNQAINAAIVGLRTPQ